MDRAGSEPEETLDCQLGEGQGKGESIRADKPETSGQPSIVVADEGPSSNNKVRSKV